MTWSSGASLGLAMVTGLAVGYSLPRRSEPNTSFASITEDVRLFVTRMIVKFSRNIPGLTLTSEEKPPSSWNTTARHVAIIMDGNRRFGKARYKDALKGHWDGGQTLVDCVQWCMEYGVEFLTVYAFSTENWKRPTQEVDLLMEIFLKYSARCEEEAAKHDIRVRVLSSEPEKLPPAVRAAIQQLEAKTANNCSGGVRAGGGKFFQLNLCVSYGARGDLALAARRCVEDVISGDLIGGPEAVDESSFADRLASAGLPSPDVIIRTSGEQRLSNFLLFEAAYAELFFVNKYWPELTKEDLRTILEQYEVRSRRFGS